MPQPNYDPDDPDEVWDHVRKTILDAVNSEDLETPQLYAAIAARLLLDFSKLQAAQLALELVIEEHNDANEFLKDASIENAEILLDQIETDVPPHAPGFAKNPPMLPD
jgi:hypothetical protein